MPKLKTKEQLLKDLKKANTVRRLVLANRAGFDSYEDYRKHLEGGIAREQSEITAEVPAETTSGGLDMVIAFDTTGSMSSYISAVKRHVVKLVEELFNKAPNLRIGVVAFGDYCDMRYGDGREYQCLPLTDNKNKIINFVRTAKNTGGGDTDEFYELVIKKVVEESDWRTGVARSFLLIGDCNPHPVGYSYNPIILNNQIDWKEEAVKAREAGIQIDTLSILGYQFYKTLAEMTDGVCMNFKTSENISQIITGLAYVRTAPDTFFSEMEEVELSGDTELIGAYKTMATLLD